MSDDELEETPFVRAMRTGIAKATSPLDQQIMELKEIWDFMRDEERTNLKSWIEQLVPLQRKPASSLMGNVEISLRYPRGEDDLRVDGLKPVTIAKAIEAWEKGEEFAPGDFTSLGWN